MTVEGAPVTPSLPRLQLALNVDDVDTAVDFYRRLFATEPAKRRPGYANFAVASPPLKLVLIENPGAGGSLNHLGVEVGDRREVTDAQARLTDDGLPTRVEDGVTCCYAVQDKVWVTDPDGADWEVYTVTDELSQLDDRSTVPVAGGLTSGSACCS
jgi:catechol 2,3-dioxygenase-like lactoylglutathione lyase family enzyme